MTCLFFHLLIIVQAKANMLSATDRPPDVQKWMNGGRKVQEMPDVTPYVDTFGTQWREWWAGLQPKGYEVGDEPRDSSYYTQLHKAGPNGLFLMILALVWWGAAAADGGEEKMDVWRAAAEEFTTVVKFFNHNLKGGRKRPRDSPKRPSNSSKYVDRFCTD